MLKYNKRVTFESLGLSIDGQCENTVDEEFMDEETLPPYSQLPSLGSAKRSRSSPGLSSSGYDRKGSCITRESTPVPPTGLSFDMDQEMPSPDPMEDQQDGRSLLDIGNAPPLINEADMAMLEIGSNGEKRKSTPPDLLTLSNLYFEKNQKRHGEGRNVESAASTRSAPVLPVQHALVHDQTFDRHNLGVTRPRKLTPLERLPRLEESRIRNEGRANRPLHLSVNYVSQGWRQALEPINKRNDERKDTFVVSSPSSSNDS